MPPPPQPIYPTEFAIQLYNPDTQVIVKQVTTKWSSTISWEFSIPQVTFRMPSSSDLDRTQSAPAADANTPRVNFAWRKEGRLGKDMTCYMTGKSTDLTGKKAKKSKEPDIAVALFSGLKEMSILEPNLYRVEIEDYKGLEVALLLGAAVIRDLFFSDPREQFHINDAAARKNSAGLRARKGSSPLEGPNVTPPVMTPQPPPPPAYSGPSQYPPEKVPLKPAGGAGVNTQVQPPAYTSTLAQKRSSLPPLQTNARPSQPQQQRTHQRPLHPQPQPQRTQQSQRPQQPQQGPRLDPRAQWEIDAETARLKAQVEAEAREEKRQAEAAKKVRRRREAEEERQTFQFLEQEKRQKEREMKERQRKQAEIDKETERLRKQFGDQSNLLRSSQPSQGRHTAPLLQGPWQSQRPSQPPRPAPVPTQPQGPYLAPGAHRPTASHSSFFSNGLPKPVPQAKPKKSFWGLRTQSATDVEKLKKKKSSMF